MSLAPSDPSLIPDDTVRAARAAFRKGNRYLTLRDALGSIFTDATFADLFAARGRPAYAPWRLALVTLFQFLEHLPDREAADAVRSRIDWKYALGLALTDPGFDFSTLSAFRARLLAGRAEQRLLDRLLAVCQAQGLLRRGQAQRTDATHVLGALRVLHRLEVVAATLRAALVALAAAAPATLERASARAEAYRLPKGEAARTALATAIGTDGQALLAAYPAAAFVLHWDKEVARCPEGQRSVTWKAYHTAQGERVQIAFGAAACRACPARRRCTTRRDGGRTLTVLPQREYEALQAAREAAGTAAFAVRYAVRAGIEGTLSQAVRRTGLRRARYRGLAKTHLQHLASASAINLVRVAAALDGVPLGTTRPSPFKHLAQAA